MRQQATTCLEPLADPEHGQLAPHRPQMFQRWPQPCHGRGHQDHFRPGQRAFDLIYHVAETVFMRAAQAGGAQASNGLGMLLHQGARAFHIWTGMDPSVAAMRQALEKAVYGR